MVSLLLNPFSLRLVPVPINIHEVVEQNSCKKRAFWYTKYKRDWKQFKIFSARPLKGTIFNVDAFLEAFLSGKFSPKKTLCLMSYVFTVKTIVYYFVFYRACTFRLNKQFSGPYIRYVCRACSISTDTASQLLAARAALYIKHTHCVANVAIKVFL